MRTLNEELTLNPGMEQQNLLNVAMFVMILAVVAAVSTLLVLGIRQRAKNELEMARHTVTVEELHALTSANPSVRIFDVRLPLDFFVHSEVIPGARRVAPKDLLADPSLIPRDEDSVVYCTCPGEETSRKIIRRALSMGFRRVRFLKGGLSAWKAKGYPVESYTSRIYLDTAGS